MNVSLQNIDKVSAELTVKLEKADYQEKVDKELKSLRQKAQIPGFRKGMVPTSLIKKMYGKSVIAEVVNIVCQLYRLTCTSLRILPVLVNIKLYQ